jgi:hypothetical protein
MWTMRRTAWSGCALTLAAAAWLALAEAAPASPPVGVSQGDAAIGEVLAFYRDLAAGDWSAVAGHFWPAKVVSRWGAPEWLRQPGAGSGTAGLRRRLPPGGLPIGGRRVEGIAGEAEGRWARVEVTWSGAEAATARTDVLWLFELGGRWKIVRILAAGEA